MDTNYEDLIKIFASTTDVKDMQKLLEEMLI